MIGQVDWRYVRSARLRTIPRVLSYALFEGRPATTRGQWVNSLVLPHLKWAAERGPCRPVVRPIFLLGVGRSGTTLLGRLLSLHPDVGFLNEPKAMWHALCPAEDVSGFYTSGPARMRLTAADCDADVRTRAHRLFGYYCWLTRSARVLDKYPELTYRRSFLRCLFPDAVLIAIVRRPEAVVRSIASWSDGHRVGDHDWWGVSSRKWHVLWQEMVESDSRRREMLRVIDPATASGEQRALAEWLVGMDELVSGPDDAPLDLLVRYEDLVARPDEILHGVFRAVGLAPSDRVVDFARSVVRQSGRVVGASSEWGRLKAEVERLLEALGYER